MLPKLITKPPEHNWNPETQMFETRIFVIDAETGAKKLVDFLVTPPDIFIESFTGQVFALNEFRPAPKGDVVNLNEARKNG